MPATTRAKPPPPQARTRYEDDLYTWVEEQVALLRAGRLSEIDALNVAEELSDVGKSERRALESALAVLVMHLLKWDHQPNRRSYSWQATIEEQRSRVARTLKENPGLKPKLPEALADGYGRGRRGAIAETNLPPTTFPDVCPFTFEEMMSRPIEYEEPPKRRKKRVKD